MKRLDARLRPVGPRLGAWLRANKLKAALVWGALIVLGSAAQASIGGVGGFVVSYAFLVMSILLLMAYLKGGRSGR